MAATVPHHSPRPPPPRDGRRADAGSLIPSLQRRMRANAAGAAPMRRAARRAAGLAVGRRCWGVGGVRIDIGTAVRDREGPAMGRQPSLPAPQRALSSTPTLLRATSPAALDEFDAAAHRLLAAVAFERAAGCADAAVRGAPFSRYVVRERGRGRLLVPGRCLG